jgi:hypothetical protein
MEIAGSTCAVCGRHVVFAPDGKFCGQCGVVVHRACDAQSSCTRCGGVYEIQESPVVDVAREAILPRSLRPSRSTSPVAMIVLGVLVLLFFMAFVFFFRPHH